MLHNNIQEGALKNLQARQAGALTRAVEFLGARETASHLRDMPPAYHVQVGKLTLAAQLVSALGERQSQGTDAIAAEGSTGKQLREQLRLDYLIVIARACRPHFKRHPGTLHAFVVPHANKPSPVVVEAARAVHKVLATRVDVLKEEGFTSKTLEEMEALTNQVEHIAKRAQVAKDERSQITRDLAKAIARGFELVRSVEGFLMKRFKIDKWLRNEWKSARKVHGHLGWSWNWSRHASPGRKGLIKPKRP